MTAIILFGPPGVGKGTQAAWLAEFLGVPAISTGQIFRANIEDKTELGKLAEGYIERGELVPDSVTNPMVQARLSAPDVAKGFVLDGYPRSLEQTYMLRDTLAKEGIEIDAVLELVADEDKLIERLMTRAAEQNRSDDREDVFRHRLEIYAERTEPLATYYADQDLLDVVDASGNKQEVAEEMLKALRARSLA
ncbi:adenylate kinase [Actinomycetaceae bacterium MB13-C1-2]|nr:adenylate kinase [Actinomycetaceae bacterium MB13-C1-2]